MRAFLIACVAIVALGAGGYFSLNSVQKPSGIAFATDGARINPQWTWRSVFHMTKGAPANNSAMNIPEASSATPEECDVRTASQWIFVDFGDPNGESRLCSISQ